MGKKREGIITKWEERQSDDDRERETITEVGMIDVIQLLWVKT